MITNKTRKKILANNTVLCKSHRSKAIGLMFSRKINGKGLVFAFDDDIRLSLHMFFVFYPIDIIFLDGMKRVVEIKESFKPFTFYFPQNRYRYALELPEGAAKETGTKLGDLVSFK